MKTKTSTAPSPEPSGCPSASTLAAVVAAAVSLTACGAGGEGESGDSAPLPTTPGSGLEAAYTPLYAEGTGIIEPIQYTEPDGTLVTFMGARPTERHARERGEAWDAPDQGPGRYFTFPTFYFQNRTFGLEIRDHVPAGRQRIEVYLHVNDGTFRGTTFSLFRNINNPNVRDFGWSLNYGFNNPTEGNQPICHAGDSNCMMSFTSNWRTSPHSPLKIGDKIELAPAPRLITPVIDGGGERYYSFEQLYVVGRGMRPWYGIVPNLDSEPLPDETLLGGQASVSYNYSEEPHRVFQQMANNIGITNTKRFVQGRRLFHTSFADGTHSEHPTTNPVFTEHKAQLGPRYNQARCIDCHTANGRGAAPAAGARLATLSVLTGASGSNGTVRPDPTYGWNVQQQATSSSAANYGVSVASYSRTVRTLAGGETVELLKPVYAFNGPVPSLFSVRQAPQVIGLGLLEAVAEPTILALADPDDQNGDGVRGVPHWVNNPETGQVHLGRFGWKATKVSLRHQAGDALVKDMSITSPVFPSRSCQQGAPDCHTAPGATAVSEVELQRLSDYLSLIGVPAQRSLRSGYPEGIRVSPEHDVNPQQIARGSTLFAQAQCTSCHTPQMVTGNTHPFAELRNQTIRPYTDLLLHDMGAELADTLTEGQASPRLWRTSPLWGIGSLKFVQGGAQNVRYLHDGRARTLTEAIGWHGGEASASRTRFEALSKADRDALLTFLESL
ncbi:di-heme oxidoredictase family protein [Stigmatella sp. ncwal1]|uniref:Di-heme oxidoredictase family protein n=1 Tax=Stigmatella ashevillensis TaxID=2995309 RepID=A0ABT5D7C2_9BACT|nr:di-heme oxidoredictase family protein [Stigmatella ashevillena]MDC0709549.1 di-heme oxidoredictase family protein [Stigmatella ashevillena]